MRRCAEADRPDWLVVVGDVNSTAACALVGGQARHPDRPSRGRACAAATGRCPRRSTASSPTSLADVLWTPSPDADENLLAEGIPAGRITRVGNIMLDSFELVRPAIEAADVPGELGLERGGYGVVTLHRPSNVDEPGAAHPRSSTP